MFSTVTAPGQKTKDLRIGTWNTQTLNKPGAFDNLLIEANKYSLDILTIQETRWIGEGSITKNNYTLLYGGTDKHEFGTAFLIKNTYMNSIKDLKFINKRLSWIAIKGKFKTIYIINSHAPTEDKDNDIKEEFYSTLEATYDLMSNYSMKILIGDMNAKLGKEDMYRPNLGKHSLHSISNDNGTRLIEFAVSKNMYIKSTMFPHKEIHKGTWRSPDGVTVNQIDHVLVDKRWQSNIIDVRTFRNADVDSDHMLVISRLREKIQIEKTKKNTKRKLNIGKLKEENIQRAYIDGIKNNIHANQTHLDPETDINEHNTKLQEIIYNAAKNTMGTITKRKEGWFDKECKLAIEERIRRRTIMIGENNEETYGAYKEQRKTTKKLLRKKKREHMMDKLKQIEQENVMNNIRNFYQLTKQQRHGYQSKINIIKDKDGRTLTGTQQIKERWKEYFSELLNVQQDRVIEEEELATAEVEDIEPSFEEMEFAIKRLKNGKSPGSDGIACEFIKKGGHELKTEIHTLIVKCWRQEKIPNQWKEALIIPLHKKNDKTDCNNYRGISLLNTCYKILSLLILKRIETYTTGRIGEYQAGFRPNRSTVDQIFTLSQILEKRIERNIPTHILFIDFKKSYDCLSRNSIWNAMQEIGVPKKLIRMTKECTNNSRNKVRVMGEESESFGVESGVKQGDGLSPLLFNITLEKVIKDLWKDNRLPAKLLAYADDIALFGNNIYEIEETLKIIEDRAAEVGLKMNLEKTKYMLVTKTLEQTKPSHVTINNETFEAVSDFKYLGVNINHLNHVQQEINTRLTNANRSFYSMHNILRSRNVSRNTKLKIYKTIIQPVILYAAETWPLKTEIFLRLQTFENKVLRKIFGPIFDQELQQWRIKKNRELYELYNSPIITNIWKSRILQWAGHVARADESTNIKKALRMEVNQARPRGRPRIRWIDGVVEILESTHTDNVDQWEQMAQDRILWRNLVAEVKDPRGLL